MTRRHASLAILLISVFCLLPAAQRGPVNAPAQAGAAPKRIISLVPSVTEMLFAIGAGNAVVGVSSYDHFPAEVETRPRVGALIDPDFEKILSLRPDLVVVYGTQIDLISRLDHAHIPIFNYQHAGLADVTTTIRAIGERTGHKADGDAEAARIERGLADIREKVSKEPRPRTLLIFGHETGSLRGIYASGGIGFLHDMLEVAGGVDVFADMKRQSVQASTELILSRAPEVILEVRSDARATRAQLDQEVSVWRALPALPAVRNGRLLAVNGDYMLNPGPRVVQATRAIAAALHPNVFK